MPNKTEIVRIKISGPAGSGILQVGEILSAAFTQAGLFVSTYAEYPSRIRGGDNNIELVVSSRPNATFSKKIDLIIALEDKLKEAHRSELATKGLIFSARDLGCSEHEEIKANPIIQNSFIAGFIWKLFFLSEKILLEKIKNTLAQKYLEMNLRAATLGFNSPLAVKTYDLVKTGKSLQVMTGNEVFSEAALLSEVEYVSIYPMTPITSLLANLSKSKVKIVMPEDEIFAVLSSIGASIAGKRALTATSGGGFCLMSEGIGFSSMAEVPLVVILGQRVGPSSGIPTYSSQADLEFAIHASHGELQRIVLAPGDLVEIKTLTQKAFNLADYYQIPVIILTDKFLSETSFSLEKKELDQVRVKINRWKRYKAGKEYLRYKDTQSGISPRAYLGETSFITNSYEHDEYGLSIDESSERVKMLSKRERKIKDLPEGYKVFGSKKAKKIVIGWGSTKGSLLGFVERRKDLKYIHINRPWPVSPKLSNEFAGATKIVVVENNSTGQLKKILEANFKIKAKSFLKDDGRPFFEEDLNELGRMI
jgi:2-oxoglutarate ferredoxin oxidoreductase subunit alpha